MPALNFEPASAGAASAAAGDRARIAAAARAGLTARPRTLPPELFYDTVGSALFEAITHLPEYGLSRADERLLAAHASAIVGRFRPPAALVELGSGSARKTRPLLAALGGGGRAARYFPIDVSGAALERCRLELAGLELEIHPLRAGHLDGLRAAGAARMPGETLVALFLGSSIGNFDRGGAGEFLRAVRRELRPGDGLLLGTDLQHRAADLLAAYDDRAGVTAAFNLNVLARINRELGAAIPLGAFAHRARWNEGERRVEMHLEARREVEIAIPACGVRERLGAGETIWTESSYKYGAEEARGLGEGAGFAFLAQWIDGAWPFAETLFRAA